MGSGAQIAKAFRPWNLSPSDGERDGVRGAFQNHADYQWQRVSLQICIKQPIGDLSHFIGKIVTAIGMLHAEILRRTVKLIDL